MVLAAAISTQAMAADIIEEVPVAPEAPIIAGVNWTGFHFGVGAGYGAATQTGSMELYDRNPGGFLQIYPFDLYSIGLRSDMGGDGWIGTVEGGYDLQLGSSWVVGIQGDYTWSHIDGKASIFGDVCYEFPITGTNDGDDDCSLNVVSDTPDITYTLETGDSWSVLGRAGYLFTPTTLIYGIGGYTHTTMNANLSLNSDLTDSVELLSYEYDRDGWTYGGGIETIVANDVSLKLEYRATSWSESQDIPFYENAGIRFEDEAMIQTIRGVISWRPGAGTVAASTNGAYETAAVADWTGFHVGAGFGYGASRQRGSVELFDNGPGGLLQVYPIDLYSIGASYDFGGDDWLGTVEGGYDLQLGSHFVVGISGDFTWQDVDSKTSIFGDVCYEYPLTGTNDADDDCSLNIVSDTPDLTYTWTTGDSWSVIGRIGYLATPQSLVYGLGGYTHTDMEIDLTINSDPATIPLFNNEYDRDGWTWGAGIETMIAANWSAKLEYRNTTWDESFTIPVGEEAGITFSDNAMVQSVRAVLSWRM